MNNQIHQNLAAQPLSSANQMVGPSYCASDVYYHQVNHHQHPIRVTQKQQQQQQQQLHNHHHHHHHHHQTIAGDPTTTTIHRQQQHNDQQAIGQFNNLLTNGHHNHHQLQQQQQLHSNGLLSTPTTNGFSGHHMNYTTTTNSANQPITAAQLKQTIYEQQQEQAIETIYDYNNHNYLQHPNGTITYQIQQDLQQQEQEEQLIAYDSQPVANNGYGHLFDLQQQQLQPQQHHIQYITAPVDQVSNISPGIYVSTIPTTTTTPVAGNAAVAVGQINSNPPYQQLQHHYNNHTTVVPVSANHHQQQQVNLIQQHNGNFIQYSSPNQILQTTSTTSDAGAEAERNFVRTTSLDHQTRLYYPTATNVAATPTPATAASQQATTNNSNLNLLHHRQLLPITNGSLTALDRSSLFNIQPTSTCSSSGSLQTVAEDTSPINHLGSYMDDGGAGGAVTTIATTSVGGQLYATTNNNQLLTTPTATSSIVNLGAADNATAGSITSLSNQQQTAAETTMIPTPLAASNAATSTMATPITNKNAIILTHSRSNVNSPNFQIRRIDCSPSDMCHQRSLANSPYVDNQLLTTSGQQQQQQQQQRCQQQDIMEMRTCGNLTQDRMDYICEKLIGDMDHFGICVIDNFLGSIKGDIILKEVQQLYSSGQYTKGRLVRNKFNKITSSSSSSGSGVGGGGRSNSNVANSTNGCSRVNNNNINSSNSSCDASNSNNTSPTPATTTSSSSSSSSSSSPTSSSSPPGSTTKTSPPLTTTTATTSGTTTASTNPNTTISSSKSSNSNNSSSNGIATRPQFDATGAIRSDRVIWIDGCEDGCSEINNLIQTLCSVITNSSRLSLYSNNRLDKIVINKRTKAHVACYPGNGTRYIKHVDNPNGDGRVITAIYYLNKDWNTERDGGLLRMFPAKMDRVANIEPLFDRALFFWSDRSNPHEVLPAFRDRFAITVWYIGESRA